MNFGYHLRKAHIIKLAGYSCLSVFKLIFLLVFQYNNWFRAFTSKRSEDLPGKDTVYRFLKTPTYNWRRFLLSLSNSRVVLGRIAAVIPVVVIILADMTYQSGRKYIKELGFVMGISCFTMAFILFQVIHVFQGFFYFWLMGGFII